MLVLDSVLGEEYGAVCSLAKTHQELAGLEREALGMTHAEVGGLLAEQWKLPPVLAVPVTFSHNAADVKDPALQKLAALVELAGWCGDVFVDEGAAGAIAAVRQACAARYGMSEADSDALLAEIAGKTREIASLFDINIGLHTSFESILKKAHETLVELTLQTQQQASALQVQNEQLKVKATTDGLTGLANRATFDAFLAEHFARVPEGKPLTLLLMDLDKFKGINDTHGHQAGDEVLKAIAKLLKTAVRKQDLAARYGGEEMAMVLPGTTRATAAAIAETIRRAIAVKGVKCEKATVPVTVSIGVATAEKGGPLVGPAHLLKAADLAVYAAKHGGRNCVKVFALKSSAAA